MRVEKFGRRLGAAAVAVVLVGYFFAKNAGAACAEVVIKIGSDLAVSGAEASYGLPQQQGAQLAVEQANAKIARGYRFELVALDDAVQGSHNPAQGAQNIRTFVADPAILGVIGPDHSNVAKAEIPITNAVGLAQISAAVTNPTLTKGTEAAKLRSKSINSFFRVCPTDDRQGAVDAKITKKLGYKRAFIIDDNETFGRGIAEIFERDFNANGGTVVGHEHITKGQQDFKALLTKAASQHPDTVYFGGTTATGGGLLRKQMADIGLGEIGFGSGDGIADSEFIKIAGPAANNVFYTVVAPNIRTLPSAKKFIVDYKKRFNQDLGPYSANGYAAAAVLINAIELAIKSNGGALPTRADVVKNVQRSNVLTPIGTIGFDANGDNTRGIISSYQIKGQEPTFISQSRVSGS